MTTTTIVLCIALFALSTITFRIWLQPPRVFTRGGQPSEAYPFVAAVLAIAFFIACFTLGVWFSIVRLRGETWSV